MDSVPLEYTLGLSALLFSIGVAGVIVRRNAIILFMCIELMLNAVNLAFVALSATAGVQGQVFVFFVIAVAAAEAAVALAILIALFRVKGGVTLDDATELKG